MIKYFQILAVLLMSPTYCLGVCSKYSTAVVNVQSILENSKAMAEVKAYAEISASQLQNTIAKQEAELNTEERNINSLKDTLSTEEFASKASEFDKKVTKMQKQFRDKKLEVEQTQANLINKINEIALEVIKNISSEQCIELVIPSINALYASDHLNITPAVLDQLNKKIPTINLEAQ